MLDNNDLKQIAVLIEKSENNLRTEFRNELQKTENSLREEIKQTENTLREEIKDSQRAIFAAVEAYFDPKFKLLFENQQSMLETLAPKSRVEALEEEVGFLKLVIRNLNEDVQKLKEAI